MVTLKQLQRERNKLKKYQQDREKMLRIKREKEKLKAEIAALKNPRTMAFKRNVRIGARKAGKGFANYLIALGKQQKR